MLIKWVASVLVFGVFGAGGVLAAPMAYDDRALFVADTTPTSSEDFDALEAGTSFDGQALNVGNMRIEATENQSNDYDLNLIGPGGNCQSFYTVDNSNHMCGYVNREISIQIDFLAPIVSWGADFSDLGDEDRVTTVSFFDENDGQIFQYIAQGGSDFQTSFFGVVLDGLQASYMRFAFFFDSDPQPEDAFGMDNVLYNPARGELAPVPLPASAMLLGSGLFGLVLARRRRTIHTV